MKFLKKHRKLIIVLVILVVAVVLLDLMPIKTDEMIDGWAVDENGEIYREVTIHFKSSVRHGILRKKTLDMSIEFPADGYQPLKDISIYGQYLRDNDDFNHIKYFSAVDQETGEVVTGYVAAVLDDWGRSAAVLITCPGNGHYKYIVGGLAFTPREAFRHFATLAPESLQQ